MNRQINKLIRKYSDKDVLRFITCGSVDDGKSTLIGRLIFESDCLYRDQLSALEKLSKGRGIIDGLGREVDYSLLLDGLQAEIEQGITIDVAYRYFSTTKRNYIVADSPGHEQYTRNMATAASTADLAVLLVDVTKGFVKQTKRHLFITNLMGINNFIVVINKMDLVDYNKKAFEKCKDEYLDYINNMDGIQNIHTKFIPLSALKGDNVRFRSKKMAWYKEETFVEALDNIETKNDNSKKCRFLVKYVSRPNSDFRGYCGLMASGTIKTGDVIKVLPSKQITKVKSIYSFDKPLNSAHVGDSVCLAINDDIDISTGDIVIKQKDVLKTYDQAEVDLVWMDDADLSPNVEYYIKFNNKIVVGQFSMRYKYRIEDFTKEETESLKINEIGRCIVQFEERIPIDLFSLCKETGSFIVIDKLTNKTSGAAVITSINNYKENKDNLNVFSFYTKVKRHQRSIIKKQKPCVVWMTGLPSSGKSTIGNLLEAELWKLGYHTYFLDGDNLRSGLNKDLGFSDRSRSENIRRAAEVSKLLLDAGLIVISAFVSPFEKDRLIVKRIVGKDDFVQVYIDTPIRECIRRDPKHLYKKAMSGSIPNFTGFGSKYEVPKNSDLSVTTLRKTPEECANQILKFILTKINN